MGLIKQALVPVSVDSVKFRDDSLRFPLGGYCKQCLFLRISRSKTKIDLPSCERVVRRLLARRIVGARKGGKKQTFINEYPRHAGG